MTGGGGGGQRDVKGQKPLVVKGGTMEVGCVARGMLLVT